MSIIHEYQYHEVEKCANRAATAEDFKHIVEHTFQHENSLNNVPCEFWKDNQHRIPCWYDGHEFEGQIYSYPVSYHNTKWVVRGVFCSPHCMKKYVVVTRDIPFECFTLISLMMRMVYNWNGEVVPASDIEIIRNPFDTKWFKQIKAWRKLPMENIVMRVLRPEIVPFQMSKTNVSSYPLEPHPAYDALRHQTATLAEDGPLPDEVVATEDVAEGVKAAKKRKATDEEEDDVGVKRPKQDDEDGFEVDPQDDMYFGA